MRSFGSDAAVSAWSHHSLGCVTMSRPHPSLIGYLAQVSQWQPINQHWSLYMQCHRHRGETEDCSGGCSSRKGKAVSVEVSKPFDEVLKIPQPWSILVITFRPRVDISPTYLSSRIKHTTLQDRTSITHDKKKKKSCWDQTFHNFNTG